MKAPSGTSSIADNSAQTTAGTVKTVGVHMGDGRVQVIASGMFSSIQKKYPTAADLGLMMDSELRGNLAWVIRLEDGTEFVAGISYIENITWAPGVRVFYEYNHLSRSFQVGALA